jgi:hypothetical protein
MKRRTLLVRAAGLVVVLGGCAGDGPVADDTPSPPEPAVEEASLTVTDSTSGGRTDAAEVSVGADTIVVDGTIWGEDGCETAALDAAEYDPDRDALRVAVVTTDREGPDMCTQAIVEVEYSVRVRISGRAPETVEVRHDDRGVTTADSEG